MRVPVVLRLVQSPPWPTTTTPDRSAHGRAREPRPEGDEP